MSRLLRNLLLPAACVALLFPAVASAAVPANVLANPGFEAGLSGWNVFGNAFPEAANPPQFVPASGNGLASMFGNFWGSFNVTGIFQEFPTMPGGQWQLSAKSRHFSGDPMVGIGAASCANGCSDNWVVQKIAFFDAGGNEIGASESVILDGTFATDTWFDNAPIVGTAPAGTVKVQALILYLQPAWAGGAAHIDDVVFEDLSPVPTQTKTWGQVKGLYR
jgi:hypothetical protein